MQATTTIKRRDFLGALAAGAVLGCAPATRAGRATLTTGTWTDAARFRAERRFASTPLGRVAYTDRGRGKGALFLHGFPLNGFQWRGAIDRLADERRCIAPDFLGLGYTDVARGGDVSPAAQVEMLVALLDGLGLGAVDVIANDSGGAVAQLLVVKHPARVRTLLLTNCDVEIDSPPKAMEPVLALARRGRYAEEWLVPWLADKKLARSPAGLGGFCYGDPSHPTDEALDCYLGPLVASAERKTLTDRYALALEKNPLAGIEAALGRCEVPARIVWGTGDTIFSRVDPDYLDSVLLASRGVRYLDGAKLFFPEELPDVIADEARGLWRST